MAVQRFFIKAGDLLPVIAITPLDANGAVVEIPEDATVVFNMRSAKRGTAKIDRAVATVEVGAAPDDVTLSYEWEAGDTDTAGTFYAEWEWLNGTKPLTIPNTPDDDEDDEVDRIEVVISEDYG
jgi:hypothetical protein